MVFPDIQLKMRTSDAKDGPKCRSGSRIAITCVFGRSLGRSFWYSVTNTDRLPALPVFEMF
jgi:hypothetical protein